MSPSRAVAMTSAMILCAGYGSRLRPLTDELPKPLTPIGDRPLLAHIVERLRERGVRRIVVNTHHLSQQFVSVINSLGGEIHVVHEAMIRGTAGGVAGAKALLEPGPSVVHNGDILADFSFDALLEGARSAGLCFAVARRTMGLGTVGLDAAGAVVRLRGERFGDEAVGADYVGIAGLGEAVLGRLPEVGCLIGDVALPLLRAGEKVSTIPTTGPWSDIGSIAVYHAENMSWLARSVGVSGSWIGAGAYVEAGVTLERSIVGAGARLTGRGAVVRSVLWPGAVAKAPLSDVIVTAQGRVVSVS